eukprot:581803-Pyramimonas_sp.AAC.1
MRSGFTLYHWNIHNHGIERGQLLRLQVRVREQLLEVRRAPTTSSVILIGDFNLSAEDRERATAFERGDVAERGRASTIS